MIAPIQTASSLESILKGDEWILFQIKEGPCAAACDYCYETPIAKDLLRVAISKGLAPKVNVDALDNAQLARFIEDNQQIGLEMPVHELKEYFSLLREAGISKAGLIGSEPTTHSQFDTVLDTARDAGIDILVYTAGMAPQKIDHPAIKWVVLHLDYGRLGTSSELLQKFRSRELPADKYMLKINLLAEQGKEFHLRVNFAEQNFMEQELIFSFYEQLAPEHRAKTLLKYSLSTKVSDQPHSAYFTPESLRAAVPAITGFVDRFREKFPEVPMYAERPLFPCSFEPKIWQRYQQKGGFVSRCSMEYTFYPNSGLALCPPSRKLESGQQITTAIQLVDRIKELRTIAENNFRVPSFDVCVPCEYRLNLTCQGGCGGYKVQEKESLVQIRNLKE